MLLKKVLFIILVLSLGVAKSKDFPLQISEVQSDNLIVDYTGQKLILVDFWATWCIPCRAATAQLEILQEQLKEEIFIISITDEEHEVVQKHISRHPSKLLVARDIKGNLMRKFGIYNRPYSILFNSDGDIIWEGHPAELTYNSVRRFQRRLSRLKNKRTIEEILFVDTPKESEQDREEETEVGISVEKITDSNKFFVKDTQTVNYYGTVSALIAQLKHVSEHSVKMDRAKDFFVHLQSPTVVWDRNPDVLLRLLNAKFNIRIKENPKFEEVYTMRITAPEKLWNTSQIDWGGDSAFKYLKGEERVQADNLTINDFCVLLSDIKNKSYQYFGENNKAYDWDVHFLFDDLMETELLNEFGIKLQKEYTEVLYFTVE